MASINLKTKFGEFREILFFDGQKETVALVMGNIENENDVLCRVHSSCMFAHNFNSIECDCREQMEISQQLIQKVGKGIVIWMEQEGKGNGHYALLKSKAYKLKGMTQADAYVAAGFKKDARDFNSAAKILKHLKVKSVKMLTNNEKKVNTLTQFGVEVVGIQPTVL